MKIVAFLAALMLAPYLAHAKTVTFASPTSIPGGSSGAGSSEAADFDRDGRTEFITADSRSLKIYDLDPTTGTFSVIDLLPSGTTRLDRFGGDLTTADLNEDGWLDIIVPDSKNSGNNGSLSWFENPNGILTDTWTEHIIDTWTGAPSPPGNQIAHMSEIDAGDINGDGKIDIVTRDISHGVFVLLQETAGSAGSAWLPRRFIPTNPREGLDLFNPDGDADLDIILNGVWLETPSDPLTGTYTLHTYGAAWYPTTNGTPQIRDYASQIAVADFNGDLREDIAISNSEELLNASSTDIKPKGIRIYLAPVDPKTQPWTEIIAEPLHFSWHSLEPTDFDCDGDIDFISATSSVGADNAAPDISIYYNDGTGTNFLKTALTTSPPYAYNSTLADADADGDFDLLAPNNFNSGPIRYFENTTDLPTTPPAAPSNLTAIATSQSSITLTWSDNSINEIGFEIQRRAPGENFSLVTTTGANSTTYQDTNLTTETTYTYRIRAINSIGNSTYSPTAFATTLPPDTQAPTPPALEAITVSAFQINLSWTGATDDIGVTSYHIFQNGSLLAEITSTTYSVLGLQPETTHTFTITALDAAANQSPPSNSATATTSVAPDLPNCLIAYWPLNDRRGTAATEALGQYPATLTGTPAWREFSGQIGGALEFSNDTDHATAAPFDLPPSNTGITLATWVNLRSFEGNAQEARFISKASGTSGNEHYWMLGNNDGTSLRFRLKTNTSNATTTYIVENALTTNIWTHLAATYDGSTMRLYKNGTQIGQPLSKSGTITAAPNVPIGIGNQPAGSGQRALDGFLDDARIYSKALTSEEILNIMAIQPPTNRSPDEPIIEFNDTTATITMEIERDNLIQNIGLDLQESNNLSNWITPSTTELPTDPDSPYRRISYTSPISPRNFYRLIPISLPRPNAN